MLRYDETNWRYDKGLQTISYQVFFNEVRSEDTVEEQKIRAERLSLVKFFDSSEDNELSEICRRFEKNDKHFYHTKNKKFHVTVIGFPVMDSENYGLVKEKIVEFSCQTRWKMNLNLGLIRLGTMYEKNSSLNPVCGVSNGTVIGYGDTSKNQDFVAFGNELCSFLLKDTILCSILGKNFRRKFPTVWCTMGHYIRDFKISMELEKLFTEYRTLNNRYFHASCDQLVLVQSCYKDLRDFKAIQKFSLNHKKE
jgi:hypothetical protein